jgi:hypothetical protein
MKLRFDFLSRQRALSLADIALAITKLPPKVQLAPPTPVENAVSKNYLMSRFGVAGTMNTSDARVVERKVEIAVHETPPKIVQYAFDGGEDIIDKDILINNIGREELLDVLSIVDEGNADFASARTMVGLKKSMNEFTSEFTPGPMTKIMMQNNPGSFFDVQFDKLNSDLGEDGVAKQFIQYRESWGELQDFVDILGDRSLANSIRAGVQHISISPSGNRAIITGTPLGLIVVFEHAKNTRTWKLATNGITPFKAYFPELFDSDLIDDDSMEYIVGCNDGEKIIENIGVRILRMAQRLRTAR